MYLSGKACPLFKVYTEETEPDCTAGTPPRPADSKKNRRFQPDTPDSKKQALPAGYV